MVRHGSSHLVPSETHNTERGSRRKQQQHRAPKATAASRSTTMPTATATMSRHHHQHQNQPLSAPPVDVTSSSSTIPPNTAPLPLIKHRRTQSYQTTPITKHYALNNQILAAFDSLYSQNVYNVLAYAIGLQFVEMALVEIPKHGYFHSSRHESERLQSSYDALRVTDMLSNIVREMNEVTPTASPSSSSSAAEERRISEGGGELWRRDDDETKRKLRRNRSENKKREKEVAELAKLAREQAEEVTLSRYERDRDQWTTKRSGGDKSASSTSGAGHKGRGSGRDENKNLRSYSDWVFSTSSTSLEGASSTTASANLCGRMIDCNWGDVMTAAICPPDRGGALTSPPTTAVGSNSGAFATAVLPSHQVAVARDQGQQQRQHQQQQRHDSYGDAQVVAAAKAYATATNDSSTALSTTTQLSRNRTAPAKVYQSPYDLDELSREYHHHPLLPLPERDDEIVTPIYPSSGEPFDDDVARQEASTIFADNAVEAHYRRQSQLDLERALYLSGLDVMASQQQQQQQQQNQFTPAATAAATTQQPSVLPPSNSAMSAGSSTLTPADNVIDIQTLSQLYHEDFDTLRKQNRVRVYYLDTYQGKYPGSVNGCTVIAPLLCIHHFHNTDDDKTNNNNLGGAVGGSRSGDDDALLLLDNGDEDRDQQSILSYENGGTTGKMMDANGKSSSLFPKFRFRNNSNKSSQPPPPPPQPVVKVDNGLPDATITEVIDVETSAILPEVRTKLGLTRDALIIPSDVHDYLLEQNLLTQSQFVSVCGGNVLNEEHLGELIHLLQISDQKQQTTRGRGGGKSKNKFGGKKIAATFFFHEHVVCIIKLRRGKKTKRATSSGGGGGNRSSGGNRRAMDEEEVEEECWYDFIDSLPCERTYSRISDEDEQQEQQQRRQHQHMAVEERSNNSTIGGGSSSTGRSGVGREMSLRSAVEELSFRSNAQEMSLRDGGDLYKSSAYQLPSETDLLPVGSAGGGGGAGSFENTYDSMDIDLIYDPHSNNNINNQNQRNDQSSWGTTMTTNSPIVNATSTPFNPNAVRVRCTDLDSLEATLKWFTCSKFTNENRRYIDSYQWDDRNSDFDPRVFQAFIWSEA